MNTTDFQTFDDKVTEEINELLKKFAFDLHTIADSYGVHVEGASARAIVEVAAKFTTLAVRVEGQAPVTKLIDRINMALMG